MIVIGLTGLIGSGKTTVLNFFKKNGALTFSSDDYVRELNRDNLEVKEMINKYFPEAMEDSEINIINLKRIIFNDYFNNIKILEKIYHVHVKKKIKEIIKKNKFFFWKILVIEVPLLFELELEKLCDYTAITLCPKDIRINRIIKRNPINIEHLNMIIAKQGDIETKLNKVDFVINTNDALYNIEANILEIIKNIKSKVNIFGKSDVR